MTRAARRRAAAPPGPRWMGGVPGARDPVVVVLLLIAFFSAISGKPLDGLLMLLVAAGLAWDAWSRRRRARPAPAEDEPGWPHPGLTGAGLAGTGVTGAGLMGAGVTGAGVVQPDEPAGIAQVGLAAGVVPAGGPGGVVPAGVAWHSRGILAAAGGVAGAALYAAVVGSFARFSWPATVAVAGLGALVVLIGWQGPVRSRPVPGRLPLPGTALWGGVLAAGGLSELWSLFQQPSLAQTSYAHPTVSALTDPVLAGPPGRALVLAVWLLLGWYLVRR